MGHSGSKKYGDFVEWTPGSIGRGSVHSTIYFDVDPRDHIGDTIVGDSFTNPPVLFDRATSICVIGVGYFGKHYKVYRVDSVDGCLRKF